jgi:DNA-directed RNA polymerase subunit H (RpoH/RPB5)
MYGRLILLGIGLVLVLAGAKTVPKAEKPLVVESANALKTTHREKCWAVARLKYGGGGDWYAGPSMLVNLSKRLQADLGLRVCAEEKSVGLLDGDLYTYPILFMTGHGNVAFAEEERKILREYLLRGGLLFADDNYGMDTSFRREMKSLFPNHALVPMGLQHPVFKAYYKFPQGLPKIHQHDGKRPVAYGIVVEGRTVVFYSYESDLGNGWEDLEVHKDGPELHESALRMGVNVVAWFLQGASGEAGP